MALTLGDDTFISLVDANNYFLKRIDTDAWDTAPNADKEYSLATATRLLNDFPYIGQAVSPDQLLAWPREGGWYADPAMGRLTDVSADLYPRRLAQATCELALHILLNENLLNQDEQTFERIKVGSIEVEDIDTGKKKTPVIPGRVKSMIKPLLLGGGRRDIWRAN